MWDKIHAHLQAALMTSFLLFDIISDMIPVIIYLYPKQSDFTVKTSEGSDSLKEFCCINIYLNIKESSAYSDN